MDRPNDDNREPSQKTYAEREAEFLEREAEYLKTMSLTSQLSYRNLANGLGNIPKEDLILLLKELYLYNKRVEAEMKKYAKLAFFGDDPMNLLT